MSTGRLIWHACDGQWCNETTAFLDARTVAESWEIAKGWGWVRRGGKHYCGEHATRQTDEATEAASVPR